jgi:hypothetical protein
MTRDVIAGLLRVLDRIRSCQRGSLSQLPDSSPAVSSLPLRHQLEDLVNCFVLLAWSKFDTGDQQLVDGWQQARVDCGLIPRALDNTGHTELSRPLVGNPGKRELSKENWRSFVTITPPTAGCPLPSPD